MTDPVLACFAAIARVLHETAIALRRTERCVPESVNVSLSAYDSRDNHPATMSCSLGMTATTGEGFDVDVMLVDGPAGFFFEAFVGRPHDEGLVATTDRGPVDRADLGRVGREVSEAMCAELWAVLEQTGR